MKKLIWSKEIALWFLATTAFALLSVKWLFAPAAWLAPALLIALMHGLRPWKSLWVALSVLLVAGLVAGYQVMPFPTAVLLMLTLVGAIKQVVPFFLFRLLSGRVSGWYGTLLFPCLYVTYDYLNSFDGGGSWGSIAYSQVGNLPLAQLASITGLWGITFLITWASAILASWYREGFPVVKKPAIAFGAAFSIVLFAGMVRTNPLWQNPPSTVRVAAITGQNLEVLQSAYEAVFGSRLDVNMSTLTQTSPELQELNKGLIKFIENPNDSIFNATHRQLVTFQDSILAIAKKEAVAGAKIVALSEGLLFSTKDRENILIEKAQTIASNNQFYLLLSMATILPGEVTFGSKYLENKALLIGPDGSVLNTFFKNKPVPLVEPSTQGDGKIPVVDTAYGRLAISICYDADFPYLMQQAGEQQADIVLLPSGDWKEISPCHAYMATLRGIENGFSVLRPASGAFSVAADYHGRVLGISDFHSSGEHVLVSHLPVKGVKTLYARWGDWWAWLCGIGALAMAAVGVVKK